MSVNKADDAIKKLGGSHVWIAYKLNLNRVTVWKWSKTGVIPIKYHDDLVGLARERDIDLSYADLRSDI